MNFYRQHLEKLAETGNLRVIPQPMVAGAIDLSSNDYLGLGVDESLREEFWSQSRNRSLPFSSCASRLLASEQDEYFQLENCLSDLYGRKALLFNSGYHANTGLVSSLAVKGTMIFADRLVHASVIDGITLSRAPFYRFRHNDVGHLRSLLERHSDDCQRMLVIVESVYSMDGDMAPIDELIALKASFPKMLLYVDEAHAFGVNGPRGLGLSVGRPVDIMVGTFGKAAASMGAFCVTSDEIHDYILNTARSFIFSTALPPICCAWTRLVIDRILESDDRRSHLAALSRRLSGILASHGCQSIESHIQPMLIGSSHEAVRIGKRLLQEGIKALPIRVPTVPAGTERIRFSLSAALTDDDIDRVDDALSKILSDGK